MLRTKNDYENNNYYYFNPDLKDFFSLFAKKEEDFNCDELNNTFEEKLFYINPIQNKLKTKEMKYNKQNVRNKKEEKIDNKSSDEIKNKQIKDNKDNINSNKFKANKLSDVLYRKDAYYKHFKANLMKYIKDKLNILKNKCFPFYSRNNFSSPNYKYTGNPKEKDNFNFLSFTIKDIMIFGKDKAKFNRQYNNELIINFIEENENRAKNKNTYKELAQLLNETFEDAIIQFYDDENEFNNIKNNSRFIYLDKFYKRETGISLLEKYGFLKVLKKYDKNKSKQNMDILHKNL